MNRFTAILFRLCCPALFLVSSASLHAHGFNVLVFTKTAGYAHGSIPAGITAINELGIAHDFEVTQTDDAATFISELPNHQVVVFLNTTGDVLDATQQTTFENWYRNGGGYVGIHAAADTEHGWPWYLELVGAEFSNHPAIQTGTVKFLDQVHPITNSGVPVPQEWTVSEEWYNFTQSPRGKVHVLAVLDEKVTTTNTFGEAPDTGTTGGTHGNDHPIVWCRRFDGGRTAYLGPGHNVATFSDATYRSILANSIEWVAGATGGDSAATINGNFEKIVLDANLSNPMATDIGPDGKVYIIERFGAVKVHDQATGLTTLIGTLDEYSGGEYGGLAIALAPDFATTNHLYIQWSPTAGSKSRVSRFTLDTYGNLNLASEVVIIDYLTNRPTETGLSGHHQAGCLRFDPSGNLLISVGDDSQASNYSPRHSSSIGRDARKSSANTNDLRGGILRITPNVGGGPGAHPNYTIPAGNLFAPGTPLTREEIYVMGARNPFSFCVDPVTGWLYYGDVGPDATNPGTGAYEGPGGHDEFNQVKAAGWFGWPYYIGNNKPYLDGNAAEWTPSSLQADLAGFFSGAPFVGNGLSAGNPSLLTNPQPAWIWYPDSEAAPAFSELGAASNRCAMAGAVYQYAPGGNFPEYYNRSVFLMQWSRNTILEVRTRPDGSILEITRFAPNITFNGPHDMRFGPDGAMYVIEWASGDLVKVQYTPDADTPLAVASCDVRSGDTPLTVNFSSAGSYDPDSASISYLWNFGDSSPVSTAANPQHVFTTAGTYVVQLTVTDEDMLSSQASLTISVGNHAPVVAFTEPSNYSFYDWGDTLNFNFTVSDAEDGTSAAGDITGADVLFESSLLHDAHQHNESQTNALSGNLWIPRDASHPFDLDLGYVIDAYYTDKGAVGVDPVQGTAKVFLQPKVTMAQSYDGRSGVAKSPTLDPVGGDEDVVSIDHGDSIHFTGLNLAGIDAIRLRASAAGAGGNVEIRQGSAAGNLIGTVSVTGTGANTSFKDFTTAISGVLPGSHDLYFVFNRTPGATDLMRLNWINFRGQGATYQAGLPVVVGAGTSATNTVRITFDQEMDFATLASAANYSINNGATIVTVTPAADQKSVDLLLSDVSVNSYYSVSMSGLEDLAGDTMASGSLVTFLLQTAAVSTYYTGLNAGGPSFTDSSGNLYLADSTIPVTLLVDFQKVSGASETPVYSNASDFTVGDPKVGPTATVNSLTANPGTAVALTGKNLTGATLQSTGGAIFTTDKGRVDDAPILDGYLYTTTNQTMTLAGLGGIAAGSPMTLTLWGVGDSSNADTRFTVSHNGVAIGTLDTDYDTASPSNTAPARVQFTFNKVSGADTITIVWGKASSATTGFNGFSLTSDGGTTAGGGSTFYNAGTAKSYTNPIPNTLDDVLYQSERYRNADFNYSIPVGSGTYDVLLRFAENYHTAAGSRTFNVSIEGGANLFAPLLDIAANVGKDAAFDKWVPNVQVADGVLDISFLKGVADNPKISAIGVFRQTTVISPFPNPSFARFLQDHPDSLQSATSDVDSDSISALMEYALGGSDHADDSGKLPQLTAVSGGEYSMVFNRPADLPDVTYQIVASSNLKDWLPVTPVMVTNSTGGGNEQVQMNGLVAAAVSAGLDAGDGLFFRLLVSLAPLQPF